jgi:hypothetical protein
MSPFAAKRHLLRREVGVPPGRLNGRALPAPTLRSAAPGICFRSDVEEFAVRVHAYDRDDEEDDLRRLQMMLQKPDVGDQAVATPVRVVAFDRARTLITLLVVLHHAVINYTYFGHGDRMRWLGFDLVVLFNDSFFMACMFFISGLFVRDSLARRRPKDFLGNRAWRLGVPFLVSIFVIMPIAYYPSFVRYNPEAANFNFLGFWWHTVAVGPLAVGLGVVLVGASGAQCDRCTAVDRGAPID